MAKTSLIPGLPTSSMSVTSFLDPVFSPLSQWTGLSAEQMSTIFGTDLISGSTSAIAKVTMTDAGQMFFNGAGAAGAALYALLIADGRGATDAWSLASHWLWDFILAATPGNGSEAQSLSTLSSALATGDINAIQSSLMKDPAQVQSLTSGWMNALNMGNWSLPGLGGAPSAPSVPAPAPASNAQAFVKRYV